jgi:sulfur carrier protein
MVLTVNGERKDFVQEVLSVSVLIAQLKVQDPEMVSVQFNGEFLDRANYGSTTVKNGDEIDFLYFMGGGAR